MSNTVASVSLNEQIANIVGMMPLSDYFKLRLRVLKLGAFCDSLQSWLEKDAGMRPPLNGIALVCIFIVASYLPALIASLIYANTCKKKELPRFDPALFTYNQQEVKDSHSMLKIIQKIEDDLKKVTGDSPAGGASSKETEQVIANTQKNIEILA